MNRTDVLLVETSFCELSRWLPQVWRKCPASKMADFSNHQRFSLRYLNQDLIPVGIRLRSTIKTPKGQQITRKAERTLLNERIRSINNTLNMLKELRDTCINYLKGRLDRDSIEECKNFIKIKREARHQKTLDRQKIKLERLCHKNRNAKSGCSNIQHGNQNNTVNINTNGKWTDTANPSQSQHNNNRCIRNISSTPGQRHRWSYWVMGQTMLWYPGIHPS